MKIQLRRISLVLVLSMGLGPPGWGQQEYLAPSSQSAKKVKQSKAKSDSEQLETQETVQPTRGLQPTDGFLFSEIEERHFSDFLVELYIQSQANGFSGFLDFLGLGGIITEENCQKLILGQAGPGHYLTLHLANLIAPDITNRETFLIKANADRERLSETVDISREAYEQAKAKVTLQPLILSPESSYTSLERSHTTDHPFYQAFLERISKLLSNVQGVTVETALIKIAEGLNLHPWMLQGYMPLPEEVTPLEIASRLARLLYDTPEHEEGYELEEEMAVREEMEKERERFFGSAIAFFSQPRALDLANAQAHGVSLGYNGMLSAVMEYLGINSKRLQNVLARSGVKVSGSTIENWKRGIALPQQESTAVLTAKVLSLQGKHRNTWIHTYRITKQRRSLDRRQARELAKARERIEPRFISHLKLKTFVNACKLIASRQDKEGQIVYGVDDEPFRQSQQEAYRALLTYFSSLSEETPKEKQKAHIVLPGGVGKTRLEIAVADAAMQAGLKVLIVVPSKIAVNGTYREFQQVNPQIKVGRIYSGLKEYHGDVILTTYASAINEFYKGLLAQIRGEKTEFDINSFDLLFADEGHRYLTELSNLLLRQVGVLQVALTATPYYHEGKKVSDRFGATLYEATLDQAIEREELANLKCVLIDTKLDMDMDRLEQAFDGDLEDSRELEGVFNVAPWNQVFVDVYQSDRDPETNERIFGHKAIVFCAGVQHAKDMARRFNEQLQPLLKENAFREILRRKGINPDNIRQIAASVSGDMRDRDIEQILEQYERGEILILTNARLLLESFDSPSTSVIMNAVVTQSIVRAGQRGMRGSRISEGKETWYVYDALPQGWESRRLIPVLFAEFATRTLQKMTARAKEHRARLVYKPTRLQEQDPGYSLTWETDAVLQIVQSKIKRGEDLNLLASGEFYSASAARIRLGKMNYMIKWLTLIEEYSKLRKLLPENPLFNTPYAVDTEYGPVTLILSRYHEKEILTARADEILPYLIRACRLKRRAPRPPVDHITVTKAIHILRTDGYRISLSVKNLNHMNSLLKEKIGDPVPIKPFLIVTEHGIVVGTIGRAKSVGRGKGGGDVPHYREREILDYLKKALELRRELLLPRPSREEDLISIYQALTELRQKGYKFGNVIVWTHIERIVKQQLPHDHSMVERFKLTTKHGTITGKFGGSTKGNIPFFKRDQIKRYILKEFRPKKKGPKAPDGYFTGTSIRNNRLREQGYMIDEDKLKYWFDQFKKQLPTDHPDGIPFMVKSRYGEVRIVMAEAKHGGRSFHVNEEDLIAFLKKAVGMKKRAPDPQPGYLTMGAFCATVRREYSFSDRPVVALYDYLVSQLPNDHPDGEPFEARDPQGKIISIMMAGDRGGNHLHANRDDVIRSLKEQGKIQKKRQPSQTTPAYRAMLTGL